MLTLRVDDYSICFMVVRVVRKIIYRISPGICFYGNGKKQKYPRKT